MTFCKALRLFQKHLLEQNCEIPVAIELSEHTARILQKEVGLWVRYTDTQEYPKNVMMLYGTEIHAPIDFKWRPKTTPGHQEKRGGE